MYYQIILLLLSLLMGIVGAFDKIFPDEANIHKKRKKQIAGYSSVFFLAIFLFLQGWNYYSKDEREKSLKEHMDNMFSEVPEASGGIAIDKFVYLVSDEKPALFKTEFESTKYSTTVNKINLYYEKPANCTDLKHLITKKDVDDLEGAASYKDKLYLITSHSDTKDGKTNPQRQIFLEVKLEKVKKNNSKVKKNNSTDEKCEIGLVTRWANLRPSIERQLFNPPKEPAIARPFEDKIQPDPKRQIKTVMEIEGLAIDMNGNVYLGFRGPSQMDTYQPLLLRTSLDQIFKQSEVWKPKKGVSAKVADPKFYLISKLDNIGTFDEPQGIVDMAYYKDNDSILILTNSSYKNTFLKPKLWELSISDINKQQPKEINKDFYKPISIKENDLSKNPLYLPAKPEVLLLPTNNGASDKIFIFLDAEEFGGGQRSYSKKDLGLAR